MKECWKEKWGWVPALGIRDFPQNFRFQKDNGQIVACLGTPSTCEFLMPSEKGLFETDAPESYALRMKCSA
jgi:hypothetical protein